MKRITASPLPPPIEGEFDALPIGEGWGGAFSLRAFVVKKYNHKVHKGFSQSNTKNQLRIKNYELRIIE
jgi:hypothetical protein